jgi:pimeloyl-ACP methyl ester carboxylesterase
MNRTVYGLLILFLVCGFSIGHARDLPQSETLQFQGANGANVALIRYAPLRNRIDAPALIFIPDLFENHRVFDLTQKSVAQYFAKKGRAVYLFDWPKDSTGGTGPDFAFFVDTVLSEIYQQVKSQEAGRSPILVGHGLGGLVALAFAGNQDSQNRPTAVVAVGTPGRSVLPNQVLDTLIALAKTAPKVDPVDPAKGAAVLDTTPGTSRNLLDVLLTNDKNFDPDIRQRYYSEVLTPVSRNLVDQAIAWRMSGQTLFENLDTVLSKIQCPVLFVSGKIDNLFDPFETIQAVSAIGSEKASHQIFSKANRYATNYGHTGLFLAPNAGREVFPYLYRWLKNKTEK